MSETFDYFVIFAEMRTGSNFLEENINAYFGLKCWGEVFNPHFIGKAKKEELLGVSLPQREADPLVLLNRLREKTDGLAGFRFFHNHDPRVLQHIIDDPRCAKVILTRNPLESYVSRKIATETGQWRLGDLKDAKTAQITFERDEFERTLDEVKRFQLFLQRALQTRGQTGFYLNYEDIQDIDVINGMARYLGVDEVRGRTVQKTKVQNPASLEDKVRNYDEMVAALGSIDHFNLGNTPNFEPARGPAVPTFVAAAESPILYMPMRGGPDQAVTAWLAALDEVHKEQLKAGFTQKSLRQWKRKNKGHRSFVVLPHPVERLHRVFCRHFASFSADTFSEIRNVLRATYKLPLSEGAPDADYTLERHREAFLKFADFVRGNLGGQTSVRVDGGWATQSEVIKGFGEFGFPDHLIREDEMGQLLPSLAASVGCNAIDVPQPDDDGVYALADFYDAQIEEAVKAAYQRDYMMFGFGPWR
ncbi:nodulation protein NodH [Celeribacter arenosi]|uniref:Nodulation protein NodH n=1 Tax=Celeribacter arenosi TaxID=792649 RepID=A0ABP7JXI8_9RHOB